jgi:hypothetical protein
MRIYEYQRFSGITFLISVLLLIKCAVSCTATTTPVTSGFLSRFLYIFTLDPCTVCPNLQVILGNALDQPVTLTRGTDPTTGCQTLTVFCQGTSATSDVILLWSLNGADQGSSTDGPATGSITRTLTCNNNSQLFLTDNGFTGVVTAVECLSS